MQFKSFIVSFTSGLVLTLTVACTQNRTNELKPVESPVVMERDELRQSMPVPGNTIVQGKTATDAAIRSTEIQAYVIQPSPIADWTPPIEQRENYQSIDANPLKRVLDHPLSTFSIDVDTGSYANVRRFLQVGQLPPSNAVRIEEMLNYFSYDYPAPTDNGVPFSVISELGPSPWNSHTRLMHVGLQGFKANSAEPRPANLVFLVDVSGSMNSPDKLGLLQSSLKMMVRQLGSKDTIALVTYAGATRVVLEPTTAAESVKILKALENLQAGGSTNGAAGIELAYEQAAKAFRKEGINRVILATDGDFNVGISDIDTLKKVIAEKRDSGIELTTLGFGTGNYNDYLMEQLADTGNGNYAYIDTLGEAKKVLVDELTSMLFTIARDVKIQIEFNSAVVAEYRLLGYSNRVLRDEDFNNDKVDAGDIGAGHSVTALYEIALVGEQGRRLDPLRYQDRGEDKSANSGELAYIKLRYKLPDEKQSRLLSHTVKTSLLQPDLAKTSDNFRFSAAVAAFGQLLSEPDYLESFGFDEIIALARDSRGADPFAYRNEFVQLVSLGAAVTH